MRDNPRGVWEDLCNYLCIPVLDDIIFNCTNVASAPRSTFFMKQISDPTPWARILVQNFVGNNLRREIKQKLYELNAKPIKKKQMSVELEHKLRYQFEQDILNTAELLDRDLTGWLPS